MFTRITFLCVLTKETEKNPSEVQYSNSCSDFTYIRMRENFRPYINFVTYGRAYTYIRI